MTTPAQTHADHAPLRVLVVNAWDGSSGVMTVIRTLAERFRDRGVMFSSFSFSGWTPDTRWAEFCDRLYSNQHITLTELLVKERFDIVHLVDTACHVDFSPDVWIARAGFAGGIVCMSQNTIPELSPGQKAHVFIACSEASRQVMARTVTDEIRIIPNGADTAFFRPRPVEKPPRPVLAWVGRTADLKQKDIFGFLHIAASLRDADYDFWIADAGAATETLRLADWFGDRIAYHSGLDREALARFYSAVAASGGAVVSTSTFEGLPLALVEAAACGCPVIAPRAPGFEYLEDGRTGVLYDRRDALAGVRVCLDRLKDSAARHNMTAAALTRVRDVFNSDRMAEQYMRAYTDAIAGAKNRPASTPRWAARAWGVALGMQRTWRTRKSVPQRPVPAPAASTPRAAPTPAA